MDKTALRTMPEEYARMLTVVQSVTALVWSAFQIPSNPLAIWMVLIFLGVVLRSLWPSVPSVWRLMFSTFLIAGLMTIAFFDRSQEGTLALTISVVVLLCIMLTAEAADSDSQNVS